MFAARGIEMDQSLRIKSIRNGLTQCLPLSYDTIGLSRQRMQQVHCLRFLSASIQEGCHGIDDESIYAALAHSGGLEERA